MKFLYALRVIFISFETVILMTSYILIWSVSKQATVLAHSLNVNEEIVKYLIILPLTLFAWIIKESKELIFSEKEHTTQLVNWSDYWKLKIHVYVSLFFGLIFLINSSLPWLSKTGISDGIGLILFLSGLLGCLWVAASIYFAQMSIKEILSTEHHS